MLTSLSFLHKNNSLELFKHPTRLVVPIILKQVQQVPYLQAHLKLQTKVSANCKLSFVNKTNKIKQKIILIILFTLHDLQC